MMNSLPDRNIPLDSPRINEMNDFLNMLLSIAKQNSILLTGNVVYHLLCNCCIKKNDQNKKQEIEKLFDTWIGSFKNVKGINVFRTDTWEYFCQFTNKSNLIEDGYIKLYIPIDYEHLSRGVSELFEYMASLGMVHASKVSKELRSDNVVVRFSSTDVENMYRIIEFCNNNLYIKSGMNKTNPFVPNYKGIGVMYDDGGFSYNFEMANALATFINRNLHKQSVSVDDFNVEFDSLFKTNSNYENIKEAYSKAIGFNKNLFQKNDVSLGNNSKEFIFRKAILATYSKYGIEQVKFAISKVINSENYNSFTSGGGDLRYQLKNNVNGKEMYNIMYDVVSKKIGISDEISLDVLIDKYISITLATSLISSLYTICNATLQKYGPEQLKVALRDFYRSGVTNRFTRYSLNPNDTTNYRDMLDNFDRNVLMDTIINSLYLNGEIVEYKDADDFITSYVNYMVNGKKLNNVKSSSGR